MKRRNGVALIIVLSLLSLIALYGAVITSRQVRLHRQVLEAELDEQARLAAESGIDKARWALSRDSSYRGEGPVALGCGSFRVEVQGKALKSEGSATRGGRSRSVTISTP